VRMVYFIKAFYSKGKITIISDILFRVVRKCLHYSYAYVKIRLIKRLREEPSSYMADFRKGWKPLWD
jgi:hypothetical protein